MNALSWLMYLADVISNIGAFTAITGCVFGVIAVIMTIVFAVSEGEIADKDHCPNFWKYWWRITGIGMFSIFVSCLLPTRNTMYAIAASEFGETIIKNERVQGVANKAADALEKWINSQLSEQKK